MITGKKTEFAIELNVDDRISERWIYGTYFFWIGGTRLGDPKDAADLSTCIRGLYLFLADEAERVSPRYFTMNRREVFIRLCASRYVYAIPEDLSSDEELILKNQHLSDPWGSKTHQYNVEDLGTSSFNNVYLLAIDNVGQLRFIWQKKGGTIEEYTLEKQQFRTVALEMIDYFEKVLLETPF